jgi:fatty-acyl-CoA synthase
VSFVTPRGTQATSFSDLWSMSTRAAHAIKTSMASGPVAGIVTPSSAMVACFVGALRSGRDFVSMPLPGRAQDAAQYARQLGEIVSLSGAATVVVESAHAGLISSLRPELRCSVVVAEALIETTATLRGDDVPGQLVQFSSGTTATAKGIRLDGTAIAANVEASLVALGVASDPEVFCAWVPLSHDMGLIGGLLTMWTASAKAPFRYICISPELFIARPLVWMESCAANDATITAAPTFAYDLVSRKLARAPRMNLASLRAAVIGAEPIGAATLRTFTEIGSAHGLREKALCPAYGLAEATLAVSMVRPDEMWSTRTVSCEMQEATYVSCGRVLDCVKVNAPDIRSGAGPIEIAGAAVCSGYLPARTPQLGPWIDTGDLGVLAEGELFVTGRSDDLLCVAGRHVFAWELERAAGEVALVRPGDCAAVRDGRGGYVTLFESRSDRRNELEDTVRDVRGKLSAVAGVGPSGVGCLPRGTLPKTPSGKIRRNALAADLSRFVEYCLVYRAF